MSIAKKGLFVAVIGAALLLALGFIFGGRKGDSLRAGNQVRAVSVVIEQYARAHSSRLPAFEDPGRLEVSLLTYLIAPGEKVPRFGGDVLSIPLLARPETGEPYIFNAAVSGKLEKEYSHPETVILFYESHENYGGRLVAFLDGHHIWASNAQWDRTGAANGF
jgi:hypothetical protein